MDIKRRAVEFIVKINPLLYGLQEKIEEEQRHIINNTAMPAIKAVNALYALDNRRIDLCNLKVLYGFMERELGSEFPKLCSAVYLGDKSDLIDVAEKAIILAGYDCKRVQDEFVYLYPFVKLRIRSVKTGVLRRKRNARADTIVDRIAPDNAICSHPSAF